MYRLFNNAKALAEGWYWLLRSDAVRRGRVVPASFLDHELAVYRGSDGVVAALDAFCPHMGAHLAEGKVEGDQLRCLFHCWKFDRSGHCTDMPALGGTPRIEVRARSWPLAEKYGLIWIWNGDVPLSPLPHVPELGEGECDSTLATAFAKPCHPHVVLINAIDEHHFNSVHEVPAKLRMETREESRYRVDFSNTTSVEPRSMFTRFVRRFYRGPLTYSMTYWNAATGTVTLGPDALHFYIMFALRPTIDGATEGQTILVTKKRRGVGGWLGSRVLLVLTDLVGAYFAKGDTLIFRSIRFHFRTPTEADHAIVDFIRHTEKQRAGRVLQPPRERRDGGGLAVGMDGAVGEAIDE